MEKIFYLGVSMLTIVVGLFVIAKEQFWAGFLGVGGILIVVGWMMLERKYERK